MPSPANWKRLGLGAAGFLIGILIAGLGIWYWLQSAREAEGARVVLEELNLPADVFRLEEISDDGVIALSLREVVLREMDGDVIARVPLARLWVDAASLGGDGPIVVREALLNRPFLNLVRRPDGEFNLTQAFTVTAEGREVDVEGAGGGRGFVLQDVEIVDGRARIATPWEPEQPADSLPPGVRLARVDGVLMRVFTVGSLDARLPLVRFGGEGGWRVEVAQLNARLQDPDVRVVALEGFAEEREDGIRFAIDTFRTGDSQLAATGLVTFGDEPRYDVEVRAQPLQLADVQFLAPMLPAEGRVEGVFEIESTEGGRVAILARDLVATALDSRVAGRLSALVGGGEPAVFWNTLLQVDPLTLSTLERLGFVEDLPYNGEVRGTIATRADSVDLREGALQLDLVATVVPEQLEVAPSEVLVTGPVAFGEPDAPIRFQGVSVGLRPLYLAALRPVVEGQDERLRGVVRGDFVLTGTPNDLRIDQGTLTYEVGRADPIRLTDLVVELQRDPLRFDLRATAQPLALATLTELFPGLPFQQATLSGPIRVAGTPEALRIDADLEGDAGAFTVRGTVNPGEPTRFDLSGRLEAFRASTLVAGRLPVQGPLTGTFSLQGTPEDLAFDVDLAQAGGQFALAGRLRGGAEGPPQFDVGGQVSNFRLGTLIGRPGLFPSPMSGRIELAGGGRQPYVFDVDLRGELGVLDLAGRYEPGDVPSYQARGRVVGLNLRLLPGAGALPATELTANINLQGRGTTLATLAGELQLAAEPGSTVAGVPLDVLRADVAARNGVLVVDTLVAALRGARFAASGTWGLTRPVQDPLRFSLVAQNLANLTPVAQRMGVGVEPTLTGSVAASGWVAGSVERPLVSAVVRGQRLRYQDWRADNLALDVEAALGPRPEDWTGEVTLVADQLMLGNPDLAFAAVRLDAEATEGEIATELLVSRDQTTDLAVRSRLELVGRNVRGVGLESLLFRVGDVRWQLAQPALVRWGGVDGVMIENLLLQRTGDEESFILVDGKLPPAGDADLRVQAVGVNLGRLLRAAGREDLGLEGIVALDAVAFGPVAGPDLLLRLRVEDLRYQGAEADLVLVNARYDDNVLVVDTATAWVAGEQVATAEARIPVRISLEDITPGIELLRDAPLSARIVADSLPLALVTASIPQFRDGAGMFAAEAVVGGTINDPRLRGTAVVADGALTIDPLGLRYTDIGGVFALDGTVIRFDSVTVRSGGTAVASGTIRLVGDTPQLRLNATLNSFRAIDNEDVASLTVDGRVALTGDITQPVLTGLVTLSEGTIVAPGVDERTALDIAFVDIGEIGADTVGIGAEPTYVERIRIENLGVVIGEDVWVIADDIRVQINGEVVVNRAGEDLRVFGQVQALRGTYNLTVGPVVREFQVVRGTVRFFGSPELNPALDIVAANQVPAPRATGPGERLTILVQITGTLQFPQLRLTSETSPPLPESEILSYLIFGRPSFQLSQVDRGLAQELVLQEAIGGLLTTPIERWLSGAVGLDYVRVRGNSELATSSLGGGNLGAAFGATFVEFGEQLTDELFLTLETSVGAIFGDAPVFGTSLLWQIDQEWSARAAIEPVRPELLSRLPNATRQYQFSVDLNRQWEYGLPQQRRSPLLDLPGRLLGEPRPPGGDEAEEGAEVPAEIPPETEPEAPR